MDHAVDHIVHVAEVAGIQAVGIGPDFVKELLDELYPREDELWIEGVNGKETLPGLAGPAGLPLLTEALVQRGLDHHDIHAVLGGNAMRLFAGHLGVPLRALSAE